MITYFCPNLSSSVVVKVGRYLEISRDSTTNIANRNDNNLYSSLLKVQCLPLLTEIIQTGIGIGTWISPHYIHVNEWGMIT